jgi:glycosyltransferase involved in cell wall biosynthesis
MIYYNLTTSIRWRQPPVGVVRVERELARALLASNETLQFCQYDPITERFLVIDLDFATQILDDVWCNTPVPQPEPPSQQISLKRKVLNIVPRAVRSAIKGLLQAIKLGGQRMRRSVLDLIPRPWRLYVKRKLQDIKTYIQAIRNGHAIQSSASETGLPPGAISSQRQNFHRLPHQTLVTLGKPLEPTPQDTFISVGADWHHTPIKRTFDLKAASGCKVILACYDTIPVMFPQHTIEPGFDDVFQVHLVDMAHTANAIFAISQQTRSDLTRFLEGNQLGITLPVIQDIPLASHAIVSTSPHLDAEDHSILNKLKARGPYILYVSTLESRKNHRLLLNLWEDLFGSLSEVPTLVCVGMMGWGMSDFVSEAARSKLYQAGAIQFHHRVSDNLLHHVFQNCLFTVFPSVYEGWGLAVTESLAHGKVCVVSNNSGTKEAAQGLCPSYHPHDFFGWREEILRLINDAGYRSALEQKIKNEYRHRTWAEFACDFSEFLNKIEAS